MGVYIWACWLVFHLGLAVPAFGSFLFVFDFLLRVCVCSFCFYFADVFSSTMWSDLRAAVPQGSSALQSLASSLPDVALASRAPSTSSEYFSSYNRCRSWSREHGLTVFPASPFHFVIYLPHLMAEAKTASPLESAVHSITWFHQLGGEPSPSDHLLVKSTQLLPVRSVCWPIKQQRRSLSHSLSVVACKADSMASLYNIRSVVICLLAFAAFL